MKLFRKKSFSKSLSARLSAAPKRKLKKALIPGYGQKGMGWLHPRKKLYNKVYNSTTIDPVKLFKSARKNSTVKTIRRDGRYVEKDELEPSDYSGHFSVSATIDESTGKITNNETGHPCSPQEQIDKANNSYSISISPHWQYDYADELKDYIQPRYRLGILLYKMGEWDKAEKQWLKLIYLYPKAVKKLGVLYRKEKRYKDVMMVNYQAALSGTIPAFYPNDTLPTFEKAQDDYEKHKNKDQSKLDIKIFDSFRKN